MKGPQGPFDPSALERAVHALRELNNSPHAHKALETMIKTEEANKAKYQAQAKQRELDRVKQEGQERRQNMERQKEINQELAKQNDLIERARLRDKLKEQEQSQERMRQSNEESVRRQEELRRETISFQMKKQTDLEEKKIRLQAELAAEGYRKNFDLVLRENEQKSLIERTTRKDIHQTYINTARDAMNYLFTERNAVVTVGKFTLFVSGAYFLSKFGLGMSFRKLEAMYQINMKSQAQSTKTGSRNIPLHLANITPNAIECIEEQFYFFRQEKTSDIRQDNPKRESPSIAGDDLSRHSEQTIKRCPIEELFVLWATRGITYPNYPKTGKTLFAKLLAHNSGLHYAVISGGDIEKLASSSSVEIDKLFLWARSTRRGTVLFVDEAESVFYKRGQMTSISNSLSTLLAQTSEPSNKISLVLASNLPQRLDRAALDRMDSIVHFEYQDEEKRREMLTKGIQRLCQPTTMLQYLRNPLMLIKRISITSQLEENDLSQIAQSLENMSARQIDKFINAIYDETFTQPSKDKIITRTLVDRVLQTKKEELGLRQLWDV